MQKDYPEGVRQLKPVSFSQEKTAERLVPIPRTAAYRSAWRETIKAADEANDPGHCTAALDKHPEKSRVEPTLNCWRRQQ
jgi:hypothetical protein